MAWCYDSTVDLGQVSLRLSDIPCQFPFYKPSSHHGFVNEFNNLRREMSIGSVNASFACCRIYEQATLPAIGAMQQMEELAPGKCGAGDRHGQKIAAGEAASEYFELQLSEGNLAFKNIELAASKIYVRGVIVIMIYFDGTIYTTLVDGQGDQPLLDIAFPDMSKKGGGFQIGTFDHPHFFKLCVWQGVPRSMPKFKHGNNKIEDTKSYTQKTEKIAQDSAVDPASTISNFGQTYIVFKHENVLSPSNHSVEIRTGTAHSAAERGVFFRFGSWCYSGRVDLGIEHEGLTLDKVHTIVPNLAKQQENMVFCTELKTLCKSSKTYQSLLRLEIAAAYVIEQMPHLISEMERLHKLLASQGQRPWIDDDNVNIYFELQLTDEGALPLEEVEAACGRVFIKGILVSVVYIANNIYIILGERDGDHALLDSTIPDISIKLVVIPSGVNQMLYSKSYRSGKVCLLLRKCRKNPRKFMNATMKLILLIVRERKARFKTSIVEERAWKT